MSRIKFFLIRYYLLLFKYKINKKCLILHSFGRRTMYTYTFNNLNCIVYLHTLNENQLPDILFIKMCALKHGKHPCNLQSKLKMIITS